MSQLDQAFLRAYGQGTRAAQRPAQSAAAATASSPAATAPVSAGAPRQSATAAPAEPVASSSKASSRRRATAPPGIRVDSLFDAHAQDREPDVKAVAPPPPPARDDEHAPTIALPPRAAHAGHAVPAPHFTTPTNRRPAQPLTIRPAAAATVRQPAAEPATTSDPPAVPAPHIPPAPARPATAGKTLRLLRPQTRVASLRWPAAVTQLLGTAAAQLDRICDALQSAQRAGQKTIAVFGACRGLGTTTTLAAIACRLADRGVRVALVDGDWQHPSLAKGLRLTDRPGWEAVLTGRTDLADAVVETADGNLAVLPLGAPARNAEAVAQRAAVIADTLQTLAQNYQLVLVDAGVPAALLVLQESLRRLAGGHGEEASARVDAAVAVCPPRTSDDECASLAATLQQAGVAALGRIECLEASAATAQNSD